MAGALRPVDLLKVGHHGSRGSTGDEWLDSLRPKAAVISVGRNDYGHPRRRRWRDSRSHRVEVRRTDREGTISVTTDGTAMTVRSRGRSMTFDVR